MAEGNNVENEFVYDPNAATSSRFMTVEIVNRAFAQRGPRNYLFAARCGTFPNNRVITEKDHHIIYAVCHGLSHFYMPNRIASFTPRLYIANVVSLNENGSELVQATAEAIFREGLISILCNEAYIPVLLNIPRDGELFFGASVSPNNTIIGARDTWLPANIEAKIANAALTTNLLLEVLRRFLYEGTNVSAQMKPIIANNLSLAWISMAKRGTITQNKLGKIVDDLRQNGIEVVIPQNIVSDVFKDLKPMINPNNAEAVFQGWSFLAGNVSVRLQLTLNQVVGTGLTAISTIRSAMNKFPTFRWDKVSILFPEEKNAVREALEAINNNPYYAWGEMGVASSRRYMSFAWIAKELLVDHGGPEFHALRQSMSFTNNPRHRNQLNEIFREFQPNIAIGADVVINIDDLIQAVGRNPRI